MFDVCLNLTKALLWINVAIFGKLGLVFAEFFVILSAAMAGAGMLIKSLVGLLFAIINASMPGGVPPEVKLGLDGVQAVLTYAFAGLGILVMIGMKPVFDALKVQVDGPKKGAMQTELNDSRAHSRCALVCTMHMDSYFA